MHIPVLSRGRSDWKLNTRLLGDRGSTERFSALWEMWKGIQDRHANLNLWWIEYAKHKLRKFWQAEGRQRADDMRLQEHFYITCIYEIPEHREATRETVTKIWYYQLGKWDLHAVRVRGLQAGGGNEIFGDESTSIFQLVHSIRKRTKRKITSLRKSERTTLTKHREIRNYVAASYASACSRMTTEEVMIKQVGAVGFPKSNASSKHEAGWANHSRRITKGQ